MENKKILTGLLLWTVLLAWVSYSFADYSSTWSLNNNYWFMGWKMWGLWERGEHRWQFWNNLTDEEKTQLQSMTQEERQQFFETKRQENIQTREAHEAVIDALLAGKTLTPEQETIRAEIIKQRAERKTQIEERQAQMQEIQTIMTKKRNWETLTTEEQDKLDTLHWSRHFWRR